MPPPKNPKLEDVLKDSRFRRVTHKNYVFYLRDSRNGYKTYVYEERILKKNQECIGGNKMAEIKAKVIKALSDDEILIDRKIRGTNIIRIKNVDELLKDIEENEM